MNLKKIVGQLPLGIVRMEDYMSEYSRWNILEKIHFYKILNVSPLFELIKFCRNELMKYFRIVKVEYNIHAF